MQDRDRGLDRIADAGLRAVKRTGRKHALCRMPDGLRWSPAADAPESAEVVCIARPDMTRADVRWRLDRAGLTLADVLPFA